MYDRRELLKASGAAISVGVVGSRTIGTVEASEKGRKLGNGKFIEIFIEHQGAPDWPRDHYDHFPRYQIDKDSNEVILTPFATEEMRSHAEQNGVVVSKNARAFSKGGLNSSKQTDPRIDGTQSLVVENEYDDPDINVNPGNTRCDVQAHDGKLSVGIGKSKQMSLSSRTVEVMERGTKKIETKAGEKKETVVEMTSGTKRVEITPVVKVINHGVYDFFEYGGGL